MDLNNFSKNGFIIIKKAISKETILQFQETIIKSLNKNKLNKSNRYSQFISLLPKIIKSEYNFVSKANKELYSNGTIQKIFLEKKIINVLYKLLGSDLSYLVDNVLTLNVPGKKNSSENYHFKDWHQEIWSGAHTGTIQFWTPLFQKNSNSGQMQIMKDSHRWGHIPNQNRSPLTLPKNYKVLETNLEVGDIILFTTTLLHKTSITKFPRLGLPILIKNFKYKNNSFEGNRNWEIFSYSEITKIERILGNHYLSPFRVLEKNTKFGEGTLKS